MLFPNDVQKLHEAIKDYFRFAQFEDTLECFSSEINAKIVSKKLEHFEIDFTGEHAPELCKMMKGVSNQTLAFQKRQKQIEEINEKYLDLLAGSRQIYGLTIKLMAVAEENKTVGQIYKLMKEKENKVTIDRIKSALLKYHKLIIPEQTDSFSNLLDSTELQLMAKKMKQAIEKAESNADVHKHLVAIRVVFCLLDQWALD